LPFLNFRILGSPRAGCRFAFKVLPDPTTEGTG
jgi:hypothetical protein